MELAVTPKKQIFISHSSVDSGLVKQFLDNLGNGDELERINFWVDIENLQPAEKWEDRLIEAIQRSFVVFVICTKEANRSPWVTFEWSYGIGIGRQVIPIIYEKRGLHDQLKKYQGFDFTGKNNPYGEVRTYLSNLGKTRSTIGGDEYLVKTIKGILESQDHKPDIRQMIEALFINRNITRKSFREIMTIYNKKILNWKSD